MNQLFRQEALDHHRHRVHGEVVLSAPRAMVWLTLLLTLVVAVTSILLLNASYARKETVPGYLVSSRGMARVLVPRSGTVTAIYVREGDSVDAGAPLMTLGHERPVAEGINAGAQALAALAQRTEEIARQISLERKALTAEEATSKARIDALREQIEHLKRRHARQLDLVGLAQIEVDQLLKLKTLGGTSEQALREKRQILVRYQRDEAELAQDSAALLGAIQEQRQGTMRSRVTTERRISELHAEQHAIAQQRARIEAERTTLITAPVSGKVAVLYATLGQDMEPGRSPLSILPAGGELQAELYVPTRAVGFIKQGQETQLLYDAFPYQRFGTFPGTVDRISNAIVRPEDAPGPLRITEPAYRVRVKLPHQRVQVAGEEIPLQPGMVLRANIILERQALIAWVIAPVVALLRSS